MARQKRSRKGPSIFGLHPISIPRRSSHSIGALLRRKKPAKKRRVSRKSTIISTRIVSNVDREKARIRLGKLQKKEREAEERRSFKQRQATMRRMKKAERAALRRARG